MCGAQQTQYFAVGAEGFEPPERSAAALQATATLQRCRAPVAVRVGLEPTRPVRGGRFSGPVGTPAAVLTSISRTKTKSPCPRSSDRGLEFLLDFASGPIRSILLQPPADRRDHTTPDYHWSSHYLNTSASSVGGSGRSRQFLVASSKSGCLAGSGGGSSPALLPVAQQFIIAMLARMSSGSFLAADEASSRRLPGPRLTAWHGPRRRGREPRQGGNQEVHRQTIRSVNGLYGCRKERTGHGPGHAVHR